MLIAAFKANVRHPQLQGFLRARVVHSTEELWRIVQAYVVDADVDDS